MRWLLDEGGLSPPAGPGIRHRRRLAAVESHRRGRRRGVRHRRHQRLPDPALRHRGAPWVARAGRLFGVPRSPCPRCGPSCGRFGLVAGDALGGAPRCRGADQRDGRRPARRPVRPGLLRPGHDQGHLRHRQLRPDERRRRVCPEPVDGLLTTLAWDLGTEGDVAIGADGGPTAGRSSVAYALEGSIFVSGAGIQWLRDGLGIIAEAAEHRAVGPRRSTPARAWCVVPAFTGLGSPYWDPDARGTILGLTRGVGRAHLARAMVEAMSSQVRDVLDAMGRDRTAPSLLRVDGGASVMGLLLQLLADQSQLQVVRPAVGRDHRHRCRHPGRAGRGAVGFARRSGRPVDRGPGLRPDRRGRRHRSGPPGLARAVQRSRNWARAADPTDLAADDG